MNNLGYNKRLFILPFDHRASFADKLFGQTDNVEQKVIDAKHIIYEAFEQSHTKGVPIDESAILVDEQYGDAILKDATAKHHVVILTVEKSGQEVFDFEYGEDFRTHIEKYSPVFVKALVRHNPEMDEEKRYQQASRLRILSDYAHQMGYKFLIEPLIPATEQQMNQAGGDQKRFDTSIRPDLTVGMIEQLQQAGVEPDIWKLEGMYDGASYKKVVQEVKKDGRENVGVVILGRGAGREEVEKWLLAGKNINGIIGFAIGRTIFWEALEQYRDQKTDRQTAINSICDNFVYFYNLFTH